jgi:formamidopyrimidine-DNA glycosylase
VRFDLQLDDARHLVLIDTMRMASFSRVADFDRRKRGPDPVLEWDAFAQNVRDGVASRRLHGEIGSALLDQAYFNGVGNYLRAELAASCENLSARSDRARRRRSSPSASTRCCVSVERCLSKF